METGRLELTSERLGEITVVSPIGEVDLATAVELEAEIARAAATTDHVCVDFSSCTLIDSTGLRVILVTARALQEKGGELSVFGLTDGIAKLFSITGMLVEGSPIRLRGELPPSGAVT